MVAIVIVRGDNWETTFRGNEIQLIRDDIGGFQITGLEIEEVYCNIFMHSKRKYWFIKLKSKIHMLLNELGITHPWAPGMTSVIVRIIRCH